jgi:diguanylate cyclase (GGDEF)-like protein/putative nucleotidyltransferase with HDIG domain
VHNAGRVILGTKNIRVWAIVYAVVGVVVCARNLAGIHPQDLKRFLIYLLCANIMALGLRLTANQALIPAAFLIVLLGIQDLSVPELLFIAFTMTVLREIREVRQLSHLAALLYAIATVTIGIVTAQTTYKMVAELGFSALFPAPAIASALVLLFNFGLGMTLMAGPGTPLIGIYRRECRPLLSWFIAAAYLAYLVRATSLQVGWNAALIATPLLFALDRGYRSWLEQKAAHRRDLEQIHQRTLDTLSIAIDSRDHSTQMHVRRVQVFAMAVGQALGLNEAELESLNVAALLHDIGKLGIPDHILLKSGPLTIEEREKMKTHALIGAQMLDCMKYPDGVVSIVRSHHEKWDGSGYPFGLKGEAIPIGARILSAVDCLDALASDRPYRTALSLGGALDEVQAEKGKSFDPRVVSVLERRLDEFERRAREASLLGKEGADASQYDLAKLASTLFAEKEKTPVPFLDPIVSARQEGHLLQQLAAELGHARLPEEVAECSHKWLRQMVTYDTLALYVVQEGKIEPVSVLGRSADQFSKSVLPAEKSLSGSVAASRNPVVNGDVMGEPWYSADSWTASGLHSVLAVPLGDDASVGVVTLYRPERKAFNRDDLRIVQAAGVHLSCALVNSLRYREAEESAATDHLTGLANARSLAAHLTRELARASRENATIGVLVCDLDGFKPVNDRFGHLKGNEVLQLVATGIRETCRASDYVARMGGDEFVIIVPGLRPEKYAWYFDRLRHAAYEAGLKACGEACLSMSIGHAIYPFDGTTAETLLAEADKKMYAVKKTSKASVGLQEARRMVSSARP